MGLLTANDAVALAKPGRGREFHVMGCVVATGIGVGAGKFLGGAKDFCPKKISKKRDLQKKPCMRFLALFF